MTIFTPLLTATVLLVFVQYTLSAQIDHSIRNAHRENRKRFIEEVIKSTMSINSINFTFPTATIPGVTFLPVLNEQRSTENKRFLEEKIKPPTISFFPSFPPAVTSGYTQMPVESERDVTEMKTSLEIRQFLTTTTPETTPSTTTVATTTDTTSSATTTTQTTTTRSTTTVPTTTSTLTTTPIITAIPSTFRPRTKFSRHPTIIITSPTTTPSTTTTTSTPTEITTAPGTTRTVEEELFGRPVLIPSEYADIPDIHTNFDQVETTRSAEYYYDWDEYKKWSTPQPSVSLDHPNSANVLELISVNGGLINTSIDGKFVMALVLDNKTFPNSTMLRTLIDSVGRSNGRVQNFNAILHEIPLPPEFIPSKESATTPSSSSTWQNYNTQPPNAGYGQTPPPNSNYYSQPTPPVSNPYGYGQTATLPVTVGSYEYSQTPPQTANYYGQTVSPTSYPYGYAETTPPTVSSYQYGQTAPPAYAYETTASYSAPYGPSIPAKPAGLYGISQSQDGQISYVPSNVPVDGPGPNSVYPQSTRNEFTYGQHNNFQTAVNNYQNQPGYGNVLPGINGVGQPAYHLSAPYWQPNPQTNSFGTDNPYQSLVPPPISPAQQYSVVPTPAEYLPAQPNYQPSNQPSSYQQQILPTPPNPYPTVSSYPTAQYQTNPPSYANNNAATQASYNNVGNPPTIMPYNYMQNYNFGSENLSKSAATVDYTHIVGSPPVYNQNVYPPSSYTGSTNYHIPANQPVGPDANYQYGQNAVPSSYSNPTANNSGGRQNYNFGGVQQPLQPQILQSNFDLRNCYQRYPDYALVNVASFTRRNWVTLDDCLMACSQTQKQLNVACLSVVYMPSYNSCDLYDQSAKTFPRSLLSLRGYDYFEATGRDGCVIGGSVNSGYSSNTPNKGGSVSSYGKSPSTGYNGGSGSSATTQSPNPSSVTNQCQSGFSSVFQQVSGNELVGNDGYTMTGVAEADCLQFCKNNKTPSGTAQSCLSAGYNTASRTCILSSAAAIPRGSGNLAVKQNTFYYEKTCVQSKIERISQQLLVGFAQTAQHTDTMENCIQLCVDPDKKLPFSCMSGAFFYKEKDENCVLNNQTRINKPDRFINETENRVEYFDLSCQTSTIAAPHTKGKIMHKLSVMKDCLEGNWTEICEEMQKEETEPNTKVRVDGISVQKHGLSATKLWQTLGLTTVTKSFRPTSILLPTPITTELVENTTRLTVTKTVDVATKQFALETVDQTVWLGWTKCGSSGNGQRVRFRKCQSTEITQCPFEIESCVAASESINEDFFFTKSVVPSGWNSTESPRSPSERSFTQDLYGKKGVEQVELPPCVPFNGNCRFGRRNYADGRKTFCLRVDNGDCDVRKLR